METRIERRTFLRTSAGAAVTLGALTCGRTASADDRVFIVDNGEAAAAVVTAENALPVAERAAAELVEHVEKATGVQLPVVAETDIPDSYASRVFLGMTEAAREQGIAAEELGPEEFVMRSVGKDVYILGAEDEEGEPLDPNNSKCGTLFGVYEFLERYLGVRWLWPGELGTFVPATDALVLEPVDEIVLPRLTFRQLRWGRVRSAIQQAEPSLSEAEEILGFSPEGLMRYGRDLEVYLRRHRMGGVDRRPPRAGHRFSGWWDRYGEEHPEWFMMHEDNTRGPADEAGPRHVPMCVSNSGLHRYIVEELWDGESAIRLGEADRMDVCQCDNCRGWDGPQDEAPPWFAAGFWEPRMASGRYARFWRTIQEMAAEHNPGEVLVGVYMYYNYFPAPAGEVTLNEKIYGEFVPWGFAPGHGGLGSRLRGDSPVNFFPMPEEAFEWLKQQWLGWKNTGMRMGYRPNYLHDGWVMPMVNTRQAGEFLKFVADHGMEGADFDSLTGQWAAHGPKLYVHMRLLAKPELPIDEILDEYYEAFGPAAAEIREYFEYWEQYCIDNAVRFYELFLDIGMRWQRFPVKGHEAFPPESFEPAEEILERAKEAAQEDPEPEYAARVEFIRKGLEHARLAGRLASLFNGEYAIPEDTERFENAVEALRELVEFRKAHEHMYISDYHTGAARHEPRRWNLEPLFARLKEEHPRSVS